VRASSGTGVGISDDAMRDAHRALGREGLLVEPSSAMAAAALPTLLERGLISADERIVVLISSSGLKDPDYAAESLGEVPSIAPDLDELYTALRSSYGFRA
jgi:threonine synthase